MDLKSLIVIAAVAGLPGLAVTPRATAQTSPYAQSSAPPLPAPSRARSRVEIRPRPLLYRRCVDWYELQHRPSGTVLFPQMRCRWVRG